MGKISVFFFKLPQSIILKIFISNPNFEDEELDNFKLNTWHEFDSLKRRILNINSDQPEVDDQTIDSWLKKFDFWYELLPNEIFEECMLNSFDTIVSFKNELNSGNSLTKKNLKSLRKIVLISNIFLFFILV